VGNITTPHDDFFSCVMQHVHIAKDAFKAYLPPKVVKKINWDTLKLERVDTRSIDDEGRKTIADVIFLATDKHNDPVQLLWHVEHFSHLPKEAILRGVHYQISALLDYAKLHPNKPLPSPITIIYYHGKQKIKSKPTQMSDLFASKEFLQYFANPVFHDITQISDETLKTHGSMSGIDLLFKYIYKKPSVKLLERILPISSKEPRQVQEYIVRYLYRCLELDPNIITETAMKYFDKRAVMTAAEQLEKRAIKQKNRESAKNLLKLGVAEDKIAKALKISKRTISALKKEIENERDVA